MNSNHRANVLVIDDDPDFRDMIEVIGLSCDVPVVHASNCKEGLEILRRDRSQIKMILLDYLMPGMEPVKCAEEIINSAGPAITVILVTAAADPAARASEMKLDRWLAKPFEASTVMLLMLED